MTEEQRIILNLWTEFAAREHENSSFQSMGKLWHNYIGALQVAGKYLKEKGFIDEEGVPSNRMD